MHRVHDPYRATAHMKLPTRVPFQKGLRLIASYTRFAIELRLLSIVRLIATLSKNGALDLYQPVKPLIMTNTCTVGNFPGGELSGYGFSHLHLTICFLQLFSLLLHLLQDPNRRMPNFNGVPMVASSPVRHDSQMPQGSQVEVQSYQQPPWKALSDFALQSDIEQPPFQQLVRN